MSRQDTYKELSDVGRVLMHYLYKDKKEFLSSKETILERYIVAFDRHLDSEADIRALGERIGIYIHPTSVARDVFFEKLLSHLEHNNEYGNDIVYRKDKIPVEDIIDMSETEYYKRVSEGVGIDYRDRLYRYHEI